MPCSFYLKKCKLDKKFHILFLKKCELGPIKKAEIDVPEQQQEQQQRTPTRDKSRRFQGMKKYQFLEE
jgi:hypothetical protein